MTNTLFISVFIMVLWIASANSDCPSGSYATLAPVITVNGTTYSNGSSFSTTENVPSHIACSVSGGEPNVYTITITCAQHSITENGGKADLLQTTFSKAENGQKCTCSASHVTGCYNLKTEITINVRYQPTVTSFTAVGKETEVTIKQGDTINFNCTASGNPMPTMYITQKSPTSKPFITVQTYNLQHKIPGARCDDTDVFYCVADNSVTSGTQTTKQRSVQVYVTCPPQTIKSGEQTHTANLNSDVTIMFDVTAYPVINTSLAILAVVKEKVLLSVDATRYSVSLVPGVAPKMTVVVTLKKVQQEDLVHYAVDLHNGVGSGATYYFVLTEAKDPKTMYIAIGAGGGGAILVIIIVILTVVIYKKRLRRNQQRANPNPYIVPVIEPHGYNKARNSLEVYAAPESVYETIPYYETPDTYSTSTYGSDSSQSSAFNGSTNSILPHRY